MIRRPPRSTLDRSSAASDVYKRQSLYVDNLFDKYAITSVRRDPSYIRQIERVDLTPIDLRMYFQSMLRPRTMGLEITYRFDL